MALVEGTGNSLTTTQANTALNDIADRLIDAYLNATGYTLEKVVYKDNDEIDKYTSSVAYTHAPICFGLGWNTFDPENNNFNIDIRTDMS